MIVGGIGLYYEKYRLATPNIDLLRCKSASVSTRARIFKAPNPCLLSLQDRLSRTVELSEEFVFSYRNIQAFLIFRMGMTPKILYSITTAFNFLKMMHPVEKTLNAQLTFVVVKNNHWAKSLTSCTFEYKEMCLA